MRIAVVDTGTSNVESVRRAVERASAGGSVAQARSPEEVRAADAIVVPGQGSFGSFARAIEERGLGGALVEKIRAGTPYLGICLGLQVLFESSDEAPGARGLGILAGRVRRLEPGIDPDTGRTRPLPHVGWNVASPRAAGGALVPEGPRHFYFAHSFVAAPASEDVVAATTEYGAAFASVVASGAVLGVQFHPEKSQREGLALLTRFFAEARAR
jgi:glutamine amidotransferase